VSIKTPRLIQDRCGVFYFRWIVPVSWRHILEKAEIRRSLRTKDALLARQTALLLSADLEAFMVDKKKLADTAAAAARAEILACSEREILAFMKSNESYKMRVRIYKTGEADIETGTEEDANQARAIVARSTLCPIDALIFCTVSS
jgi:hypothetical protein